MNTKRTFGKELQTVFECSDINADLETYLEHELINKSAITNITIDSIIPNKYIIRRNFDHEELQSLAKSLSISGILQPLIVRKQGQNYEIVVGQRRWLAAKIAEIKEIPVIICDVPDQSLIIYSLIENIQRSNLNPIEQALAFWQLQQDYKLTHEQIANHIGSSRTAVTNVLRLLSLPESVRNLLSNDQMSVGHAKILVGLDSKTQISLAKKIVKQQLSVRETEVIVNKLKSIKVDENEQSRDSQSDKLEHYIMSMLEEKLSLRVRAKLNEKCQGRVIINIQGAEELEILMKMLELPTIVNT